MNLQGSIDLLKLEKSRHSNNQEQEMRCHSDRGKRLVRKHGRELESKSCLSWH